MLMAASNKAPSNLDPLQATSRVSAPGEDYFERLYTQVRDVVQASPPIAEVTNGALNK